MNTIERVEHTSKISHSDKKYHNRICLNKKSVTAMFLSAALLLTAVDSIQVRAEELSEQIPTVLTGEEAEIEDSVSGNTLPEEEEIVGLDYVKTESGAVIIDSFTPLSEEESQLILEETESKLSLEEVTKRMPETLKASAKVYVSTDSDAGNEAQPGEGEEPGTDTGDAEQPGEGEEPGTDTGDAEQPGEGEEPGTGTGGAEQPGEGEEPGTGTGDAEQPGEGEGPGTGTGDAEQPGEGEEPGTDTGGAEQPGEGEEPGTGTGGAEQPGEGEEPGTGTGDAEQPGEGEEPGTDTGDAEQPTEGVQSESDTEREEAVSGHEKDCQWRLLVAAKIEEVESESNGAEINEEESAGNIEESESFDDKVGDGENGGGADQSGNVTSDVGNSEVGGAADGGSADSGTDTEDGSGQDAGETVLTTEQASVEVPVQWICADDYENTALTEYIFHPAWDEAAWFYEAGADGVPTITVSYSGEGIVEEVSTEEELAAAFAAGLEKIVLKADIALTRSLILPASADIELDGQGYSLLRGMEENAPFLGTMIRLDGEGYTEETYGTLTLKNITVNGETAADRAGAPAILNCGSLILEEKAVVRANDNYGTYPSDEGTEEELILDYGGGIQVQKYGQLTLTENSLVTENFADEFGGGVYLADGATLSLYADVIRENSVSEDAGYGADLYAAAGSTIYYDSSVDMERDGFYLCEGAILICMQGQDADSAPNRSDRNDPNVEIYISASEGSGYNDQFLEKLKIKLEGEPYNYTVIPKSVQVDTTDLRDWYVYDHYDTDAWQQDGTIEGSTAEDKWKKIHGGNPRREYYPCTTSYYCTPTVGDPVYTIPDWLDNSVYKISSAYRLAKFKEHIDNQGTNMTFVGYDHPAYIDFMFYQPQLADEKVVDFDIDSSRVISHALSGAGFLMNAGVEAGKLYGYLVYYHYGRGQTSMGDTPTYRYVCKLNGVDVTQFHNGTIDLKSYFGLWTTEAITEEKKESLKNDYNIEVIDGTPVSSENWNSQMSIRIQASDEEIQIRQQPKDAETDIGETEPKSVPVENLGRSGFGPLVAYTAEGHTCDLASCFIYSNVSMRYTRVTQGGDDLLLPLERADYTQERTQKYFLNLFGTDADKGYNTTGVEAELYQRYLKLMQVEGIALITDRKTPFEEYLGESGAAGSNLCEISEGPPAAPLTVDELAEKIADYIGKQTTTYIQDKVSPDGDGEDTLKEAAPNQAVGNIWIESAANGVQLRELWGDDITGDGYEIRIRDEIADYLGDKKDYTVTYEVLKPNGSKALDSSAPSFKVGTDVSEWPTGRYTVRQTITGSYGESTVHGYAYFDLRRSAAHEHNWAEEIVEPDCTTDGRKIRTCAICGRTETEIIPAKGHQYKEDEWGMDDTVHWHECEVCHVKFDDAVHSWGDIAVEKEADCTTAGSGVKTCTVCGKTEMETIPAKGHQYKEDEWGMDDTVHWHECEVCHVKLDSAVHTWSEYTIEQEAGCTTEGRKTRTCAVCGIIEEEILPAKGHSPKEEWSVNLLEHWHECRICEAKLDASFHRFGAWITDEEATEDKDGSKHRACTDCGYKEFDSIVRGKITKREDCGEGAPQTVIATALPALALATLAEEDVHAVGNGTDIEIVLNVENADTTVSVADKEAVASAIKSYKVAQYFDMTLYKEMKEGRYQIAETGDEIRLTIEIPGKFRNTNRKYAVVRVHDGVAVMLLDLDSEDDTVTIETDRFSTYAFVYVDPKKESESGSGPERIEEGPDPGQAETSVEIHYLAPKKSVIESTEEAVSESQKDSEPKTGQTTHFELYATIAFIQGASYLFFLFGDSHGMTEETKAELVSRMIRWAKKGGKIRRLLAIAAIFVLLVYYHSIGKQVRVRWQQVCGG